MARRPAPDARRRQQLFEVAAGFGRWDEHVSRAGIRDLTGRRRRVVAGHRRAEGGTLGGSSGPSRRGRSAGRPKFAESLRGEAFVTARLGGDEFVVLAEDLDDPVAAAQSLAERIRQGMRVPITPGDRQLHTSVSIGIAPVPPDCDPEACLAQADSAMYQAKRGGPARFESFNDVIGKDNQRRIRLADELRMAHQRQDPDFHGDVVHARIKSRLDASCLVLEVTESVLVMDIVRIGETMQRIRYLGVHTALDDFGTGYSSLLYLKGLPNDRLKADRSFVAGLGSSGQDPSIVSTVVHLAHKLGLRVVAEGVETEAELQAVGDMGCDEAQGYLLGRPGPANLFTAGAWALAGS
jgi:predicted signal transduction protein with EAL and GGDEF domain